MAPAQKPVTQERNRRTNQLQHNSNAPRLQLQRTRILMDRDVCWAEFGLALAVLDGLPRRIRITGGLRFSGAMEK